jgi:hypothetical protein
MSDETPRLKLAQLVSLQELNNVTWNEALAQLDALSDLYLLGQFANTPPNSSSDGDAWLIGGTPTGAWTGYAYKIAACLDGAWRFYTPFNGLRAYVASSKAFLIYQNGVWSDAASTMTGLLDLGAAGQIKFPAAQNPSSNANTLDDYEEGTFTPYLTATVTPPTGWTATTALGEYVKIGTYVFVNARLVLTSKGTGGAGNGRLGGLPFTVRYTAGQISQGTARFGNVNLSAGYTYVTGVFYGSAITSGFAQMGSGLQSSGFDWASNLNDNSDLAITGGYLT